MGVTDESRNLFAKLDLKRAMTLPSKLLFLSYAKTSVEGKALRRLNLLDTVEKQILPALPQSPVPEDTLPQSAVQALAELSVQLRAYLDGKGGSELTPAMTEKLRKLLRSRETAPAALSLWRRCATTAARSPSPRRRPGRCTAGKRCPSAGWSGSRAVPSSIFWITAFGRMCFGSGR